MGHKPRNLRASGEGRSKPSRTKKPRTPGEPSTGGRVGLAVLWLLLSGVWVFVLASLVSFDPADPPTHAVWPVNSPPRNWCGLVGSGIAFGLLRTLGLGVIVPMAFALASLAWTVTGRRITHPIVRALGVLVMTGAASVLFGTLFPGSIWPLPVSGAGGTFGYVFAHEMVSRFAVPGTVGIALAFGLVGMTVAAERVVLGAPLWAWRTITGTTRATREAAAKASEAAHGAATAGTGVLAFIGANVARAWALVTPRAVTVPVRVDDLDDVHQEKKRKKVRPTKEEVAAEIEDPDYAEDNVGPEPEAEEEYPDDEYADEEWDEEGEEEDEEAALGGGGAEDEDAPYVRSAASVRRANAETPKAGRRLEDSHGADGADSAEDDDPDGLDAPGAPQVFDRESLKEKMSKLPVRFASTEKRSATDADLESFQAMDSEMEGYRFPGMDLLEEPDIGFGETLEAMVRENAAALEAALRQYKIQGEVVDVESGPVITLYHVALAPGTKVASLNTISSDLARALKAVNIRIVPNMVGRDTVGIEVPNAKKERVRLKELMSKRELFEKMKLPMFLGKDASGDPLIADLTKAPHMLIAGTTGSGKSVCMNTIIMSWLYTKKPNELKLVLVDPKMVEMSQFKDIPHLMCPVVTEMSKAAAILEWACVKMDERYELLAEAGCRDIVSYNEMSWEEKKEALNAKTPEQEARIPRKLPYMVFIIDELADLMMTAKEVEGSIIRIAQKARAVGIHLILATQRPQANVVTGLIKGNMPCRITFKVASGLDSRIVLDQKGGELLLGQGDMLYLSASSHKLSRAQGTLVDDKEIRRVVKFMKEVAAPTFERQLVQLRSGGEIPAGDEERIFLSENNSSASLAAAQEDPLFDRAVEIVLETKRGSVSLLQRRLAIGYTRASRLIDLMGIAGIISDHKGSVARDVLITIDEWQAMKQIHAEMLADAEAKGQRPLFATLPGAPAARDEDGNYVDRDEDGGAEDPPFEPTDEEDEEAEDPDEGYEVSDEEVEEPEDGAEEESEEEGDDELVDLDEVEEIEDEEEDEPRVQTPERPRAGAR